MSLPRARPSFRSGPAPAPAPAPTPTPTPTPNEAMLVVDGRPVAPLALATSRRARRRGLLGRSSIEGGLLLSPASSVHSFGMRFALDVALCDAGLRVLAVVELVPGRATWPRARVRHVLEAEAGAFARWGLAVGARLSIDRSIGGFDGPAGAISGGEG